MRTPTPPGGTYATDPAHLSVYSRAACLYVRRPAGVLFPRGPEDLAWALGFCRHERQSLTLRGGGSGLAGQTVGRGIVADVSRWMNRILRIDPERREAVVEPGVVCSDLNRAAALHGLRFSPDPSSQDFCTVGGMLANNSKGGRAVRYGTTVDHVRRLRLLLADGKEAELARGWHRPEDYPHPALRRAAALILASRDRIEARWPRSRTNASGYNLLGCLGPEDRVDLVPLFVGSEGTLGVFLEAAVGLEPIPKGQSTALVQFEDVASAAQAVLDLIPLRPSALEIMDNTFLDIARRGLGSFPLPVDDATRCVLILESDGGDAGEAEAGMDALLAAARGAGPAAVERAGGPAERAAIWAFRRAASPLLNKGRGRLKSVRFIEDGAVPTQAIPDYLRAVEEILSAHGIETVVFGHAGDGNFHVNPFMDLKDPEQFRQFPLIAREVAQLLASLGGTLSGEHGDGRLRTPFLPLVYGDLTELFRRIKLALDPEEILNPGIIAPAEPEPLESGLRYSPGYSPRALPGRLSEPSWALEAERCHGCGTCRDFCPTAQASRHDLLSSRGRAHLLQALLAGELDPSAARKPEIREIFESCLGCSQCLLHCPTGVDVAPLASVFREAFTPPLARARDAFLAGAPLLGYRVGPALGRLAGRLAGSAPGRLASSALLGLRTDLRAPLMAPAFGFDPERLYRFDAPGASAGKAAYFYGCFGNTYNPEGEARLAVAVLNALGIDVVVPPQACCGLSGIARGLMDRAVEDAGFTRRSFLPWVERGYAVVSSAPSCLLAIQVEHPRFFPGPEAEKLAAACRSLFSFVQEALERRRPELRPVSLRAVYQTPCHASILGSDRDELAVLGKIPGLELVDVTTECCGMAGSHGAEAGHAPLAEAIAIPLYERIRRASPGAVVTPCGSCKLQDEAHLGLPVHHPLEVLARALGVLGEETGEP